MMEFVTYDILVEAVHSIGFTVGVWFFWIIFSLVLVFSLLIYCFIKIKKLEKKLAKQGCE